MALVSPDVVTALTAKFDVIFPHLDERQRRLLAGAEACSLGHGGVRALARAAGMREGTGSDGVTEVEAGAGPLNRGRRGRGGRKTGGGGGAGGGPAPVGRSG